LDLAYFLSKAFWFLARPGNLVLLIILIGTLVAWVRPAKSGRIWLTALSALLLFVAFAPVYTWIARPLEYRFSPVPSQPAEIDGILVLGGLSNERVADHTVLLTIGGGAEREDHPTVATWFSDIGIDDGRIVYESESRNTFENAFLAHRKVQPGPNEVWLLVTSAQHMPRAVGVFRKIGWPLVPYPVDYQTAEIELLADYQDVATNLAQIGVAFKEWVGLVAYYVMDRTDELFPAPQT
jgi:uncharacterized SAM-binding protein YcdF (DUF218 family)